MDTRRLAPLRVVVRRQRFKSKCETARRRIIEENEHEEIGMDDEFAVGRDADGRGAE